MSLAILYRGALESCNYACDYCPFAKRVDSNEQLAFDRESLNQFVDWVLVQSKPMSVFFTPWGEALTRRWYREAMIKLSHTTFVEKVCAQTNLGYSPDWLTAADKEKTALWTTFHPSQVDLDVFCQRANRVNELGYRLSVGIVGKRDYLPLLVEMRKKLSDHVYIWVNAFRKLNPYYSEAELEQIEAIDPLFRFNLRPHVSQGSYCEAGHKVVAIDEQGDVRRCHFLPEIIGNIYKEDIWGRLVASACTAQTCGCHIGYVHKPDLGLKQIFANGVLERIPSSRWTNRELVELARGVNARQSRSPSLPIVHGC